MYHLLMYLFINETVADADCESTLQVAAHIFISTILPMLWFSLCLPALQDIRFFVDHQPSLRRASRTKSRRRRMYTCYHIYKTRNRWNRWKRRRSFRKPGRRHLGMRGVHLIRIPNNNEERRGYSPSLVFALMFVYRLVCMIEIALRIVLSTIINPVLYLIRIYNRVLRSIIKYAVPINTKAKHMAKSQEGSWFQALEPNLLSSSLLPYRVQFEPIRGWRVRTRFVACSTVKPINECRFDSDSTVIGVDSHASVTMSSNPEHFEDLQLLDDNATCQGFTDHEGAGATIAGEGTFVFNIEDDDGRVHTIRLPGSLYIPSMTSGPLLCPQHWAQEDLKNGGNKYGTGYSGHDDGLTLHWGNNRYHRRVSLNPSTNTPYFHTAPGSKNYRSFAAGCLACDATRPPIESMIRLRPTDPAHQHQREVVDDWTLVGDEYSGDELLLPSSIEERNETNLIHENNDNSNNDDKEGSQAHGLDETMVSNNNNEAALPTIHYPKESLCPLHPESNHLWKECSQFRRRSLVTEGAITFDPNAALDDDTLPELQADDPKAELLRWHYRLGHLPFAKIQAMAKAGDIPRRLASIKPPVCPGCLFGAMTRVPKPRRDGIGQRSGHDGLTIFEASKPGEHVSVDQLISTQVGFVAQLKGKLTVKRYKAATVFVDHYSRLRYIHLMCGTSSEETLQAKRAFEQWCQEAGVRIKHYHCDNGRFADKAFMDHCAASGQRISYCGVNAHNQNGIAERAIRDIQDQARKQLLHAKAKWPAAVDLALWPYALRYAVHVHNMVPVRDGNESCMTKFTGVRVEMKMRNMHTLFCPVFALQNELAAGNKIPKWSPRARLGLNLGQSPTHARNVSLVLNLETGLVSPQVHVKYDDFFETVQETDEAMAATWKVAAGFVKHDGIPSQASAEVGINDDVEAAPQQLPPVAQGILAPPLPDLYGNIPEPEREGADNQDAANANAISDNNAEHAREQPVFSQPELQHVEVFGTDGDDVELQHEYFQGFRPSNTSLRGRRQAPSRRLRESRGNYELPTSNVATAATTVLADDRAHDEWLELQERMRNPIAFHAEMMGDIMYYHQAMKQHDAAQFTDAVVKEVNGHVEMGNWQLVRRDQVPDPDYILPSVWAMRRKRNLTTNEITKYKARLNIHGGKQTFGVNYFDTYAPVVTWFAIRLIIIFAMCLKYHLKQIDFVMAYPQAPIENDMYMELPAGIRTKHGNSKDYVLKIVANLYGQKQAGRVWNQYLVDKLRSLGFEQSLVDECVFYRGSTIFIVYVDDGIVLDADESKLSTFVKELRDVGLNVEDQGHPSDYVGVNIKKDQYGRYNFTQTALIDSIIRDVGVADVNATRAVPAKSSVVLLPHKTSPKFDESRFSYRSAVGKLNYLAQTTRPDIMVATHMIARYSHDPRKEHGEAIVHLALYLKGTRHIGLRFAPDPKKGFENYVDADFSGLWNRHHAETDPSTAKSRSGWIIFYAGCPIMWSSKIQGMVALSTTEAEYIALSQSLRDVLPMMELVEEIKARGFNVLCTEPFVYCKTFEDNSGALELARLPKLRPRSKHINTCYHHFREFARKGLLKFYPISTTSQIADVLTKNLPYNDFMKHRVKMCGQ